MRLLCTQGMRAAILKRMAEGATEKAPGPSDEEVLAAMMAQQMHAGCQEDHDDDDDADDFMEDYRRKRLQELKVGPLMPIGYVLCCESEHWEK